MQMTPLKFVAISAATMVVILSAIAGAAYSTREEVNRTTAPATAPKPVASPIPAIVKARYTRPAGYLGEGEEYTYISPLDHKPFQSYALASRGKQVVSEGKIWLCSSPLEVEQAQALWDARQTVAEVERSVDCALIDAGEHGIVMDEIDDGDQIKVKLTDYGNFAGWAGKRYGWAVKTR